MEDQAKYWDTACLIRYGLFDSRDSIKRMVGLRRFPAPRKVGGRAVWKRSVVEDWVRNQSILWIPRSNKS
jgi:hypothetical protein